MSDNVSQNKQAKYNQGSILIVNLDPVEGSEQGRSRPCVVVSNTKAILASKVKPLYVIVPFTRSETLEGSLAPRLKARKGGLPSDSVALVMHIRSIDPVRIKKRVGILSQAEIKVILEGIQDMVKVG